MTELPNREILLRAKAASAGTALLDGARRTQILLSMADALEEEADKILAENRKDTEAARDTLGDVMLDRLALSEERIAKMAKGIRDAAALPDPVGRTLSEFTRPNGLNIRKVSVPLGLVAMIYESRPNVTADAAALAFRSGNAVVLKPGKEALGTSRAIVHALRAALEREGVNPDAVSILSDCSREGAKILTEAVGVVDLLIPRGGAGLIRYCVENAKVPCIETGTGICHVYVDRDADIEKALAVIENAKTSRPSVCNAEEVLLVDRTIAKEFLPKLRARLTDARAARGEVPVELRLDPEAAKIIEGTPAGEKDFDTEFLDYILAVKVVADAEEAIRHIAEHSTHHSDAILTENEETAARFTAAVDSAAVYVNASTRFTDGGEFGLGCEIGISTQKLHARGPMGTEALTSYKYIVKGNGQIR